MTNLLLRIQGAKPFTWGRGSLTKVGVVRGNYIRALQAADHNMYEDLEAFVRS